MLNFFFFQNQVKIRLLSHPCAFVIYSRRFSTRLHLQLMIICSGTLLEHSRGRTWCKTTTGKAVSLVLLLLYFKWCWDKTIFVMVNVFRIDILTKYIIVCSFKESNNYVHVKPSTESPSISCMDLPVCHSSSEMLQRIWQRLLQELWTEYCRNVFFQLSCETYVKTFRVCFKFCWLIHARLSIYQYKNFWLTLITTLVW